ncbi:MAG: tetratricopeptide repeat protein [Deltaproteobacteria bacterium]|nr:tetratricopeptide repeat protein [Deltaproteobacteria bacterium]
MMRRVLVATALLGLVVGIEFWRRPRERAAPARPAPTAAASPTTAVAPAASPNAPPAARATPPPRGSAPPAPTAGAVRREDADRLLAEGKVMEAVEAFREVVAAEPTARNHGDFGGLLYRLTAFDEAAIHLRAAAELDPGNADRWIALANVYYRKVNPGEAWKAERRAREAEPGLELGRDADGMRVRKGEATARQP